LRGYSVGITDERNLRKGAMVYITSFIKIGSGMRKFSGGDTHTKTERKVISLA
jgi:hypothetical protein